jgi:hypothetical protein
MVEQIKLFKMQQILPTLKQSLRKSKLRTEADETIVIRALKQAK